MTGKLLALAGRIVTMNAALDVIPRGVIYLDDHTIVAVQDRAAPAPDGFTNTPIMDTGGTLLPGLIELHNHLPYDVLTLWKVPRRFTNRGQWSNPTSVPDYRRLISGPMGVLGRNPDVVPAIVRYIETRALLGGTTTSQGVALASNSGIVKYYRGLVRNVESTGDLELTPATTRIADIDATDADRFLTRLQGNQKLLLHLAEGIDATARQHFLALKLSARRWAITPNLIGIHCAALTRPDFAILATHGGSMVWSPLSNLLLYGQTARLDAAHTEGVPIALGSDWSPSGSKNLLGELKIARAAAALTGAELSDQDLVAMATSTPARMLGWDHLLGSLQSGRRADLLVVRGRTGDPYTHVIDATEADLDLVMIDGVARVGSAALMRRLGHGDSEPLRIGRRPKLIHLTEAVANPDVAALSVSQALDRLAGALADLPRTSQRDLTPFAPDQTDDADPRPLLAVAGVVDNRLTSRPHLPYRGRLTGFNLPRQWAGLAADADPPLTLPALALDPLTAVDNPGYPSALAAQPNLPPSIIAALQR